MAKCKKCGKKGLFLILNSAGLCNDCAAKVEKANVDTKKSISNVGAELKKQDEHLDRLAAAETEYKQNGDINKIIAVYEDVFIKQKSTLNSQKRWFDLVDLYIKNGQNDKAWAWLNQLAILHPDYISKIEEKRYKILKKENKHL